MSIRSTIPQLDALNTDLVFQASSWHALDYEYDGDDDDEDDDDACRYLVKVFGVTENGQSVSANLLHYTPFFYIKLNHPTNKYTVHHLHEFLVGKLPYKLKKSLLNVSLVKKKDFWGFTNSKLFTFVRFKFKNLASFKFAVRVFSRSVDIPGISRMSIKYKLYESNIEPFLRMCHIRDVEPTGWIEINKGDYENNIGVLDTHCQIDINCKWTAIKKHVKEKLAPMMVASFDLECTSSHGDFPVARKNYKKMAYELLQYYNDHKDDMDIKESIYQEILKSFDVNVQGKLSKVYLKTPVRIQDIDTKLKRTMDDIYAILIGKLGYKRPLIQGMSKYDNTKNPTPQESINKDAILKELTRKFGDFNETDGWSGIFPPIEGDPIIQIGTTVHRYGDKECTYKSIVTLGTCDEIEGVDVHTCKTEKELMLKWRDIILKVDPDIMTGYNIFGFDMSYLYDRSRELGIMNEFCKIGRIIGHKSEYVEKVLSSSALGDNLLKYIDMEGRVLIDIMKVVQRDHKLDSYKLDSVANHFMKMNKHDVHPSDIFRLQKGSSADRKVIAEYCVVDCALCNHLMMKLEILANNIGMSNVCNVPLSYIFMRGQGIKIFSLVAKECREDDFLIPTLNNYIKDDDDNVEDEDGYEGAIVLEPKEGIYIDDPVSVLDYASLYPSSMISENLSHDSIVLDKKYDNIPGYEYLDVVYDVYEKIDDKKVKKGEKSVRYVQFPNDEKGTIPKILMKLLRQRKETRKKIEFQTITIKDGTQMCGLLKDQQDKVTLTGLDNKPREFNKEDIESIISTYDDFQKAVLDGLQNAYKVTANSLYGQCGARTSPIYMKDIAACTTATGRKLILMARDYILANYEGAEIIYGDSVTGDTPLLIKFPDETIDIVTIECLQNCEESWIGYDGFKPFTEGLSRKQQSFVDAKIWTNGQWSTIHRVIRHASGKKIYRVNTFKGCVDVTEDHSLIDVNGKKIKPLECIEGETQILHSFPTTFLETELKTERYVVDDFRKIPENCDDTYVCECCRKSKDASEIYVNKNKVQNERCRLCIKIQAAERLGKTVNTTMVDTKLLNYDVKPHIVTREEAWVWGFFFGDGSCGYYNCESSSKYSWAINNSNLGYLNKARAYLIKCEQSDIVCEFEILDTMNSSGVYKLVPLGSMKYMVEKYRGLFYDKDKLKKVPKIILNSNKEVREWFLEGYLTADGCKKEMVDGGLSFACKGKIGAQGLFYVCKSIGWDHLRVYVREYKDNIYWIRYTETDRYYEDNKDRLYTIMDLQEVYGQHANDTFVYDIETSSGKFHGGVGEIVISNTDSIFCKFNPKDEHGNKITGKDAIPICRDLGIRVSKEIKPMLKHPHDLEWEKLFWPFILFSKKRYCANKYEFDDNHYKMNSMGIVLKRRDNAHIVKKVYGGILDIILNERDVKKSVSFLKESLNNLINGDYPLEDLIITKSLRADYKDPDRIAHKVLAERMGERDPGNKPQVNDRIPFVYVQVEEKKGKKMLQGERIEHPDYIREKKLKPDYEFYITNQIMKPVLQLYALSLENLDGYRKPSTYFDDIKQKLIKDKEGDMKKVKERLSDLKEDEVKKLLFEPYLTVLKNKKNKNSMITDFFKSVKHTDKP